MAQTREVRGVATRVYEAGGMTHVQYHETNVVSFNAQEVVLRTGGWATATTKLRMNQAASQFNLGFRVAQKKGQWFVWFLADGTERPFVEGMTVPRVPCVWTGERWAAEG